MILGFIAVGSVGGGSTNEEYIVWNMRGQSNVMGRVDASTLSTELQAIIPDVYIFNYSTLQIEPYQAGVNSTLDDIGSYGYELYLAILLRDYHNKKVVIYKYGRGGTRLEADSNPNGDWAISSNELIKNYETFYNIFRLRLAKAKITQINPFSIWHQGESDALNLTASNNYEVNETATFARERAIMGVGRKIINVNIQSTSGTYASTVRTAKVAVDALDSNVYLVDSEGLATLPDDLHLADSALQSLATSFFNLCKDWYVFT
jgi:hypothetical protein